MACWRQLFYRCLIWLKRSSINCNGEGPTAIKKGFTILELLVVLTALVVLAGITIPRIKGMQDESGKARARAELRTLRTALESYYDNAIPHAYPATSATVGASSLVTAAPAVIATPLRDPFGALSTTEYGYILSGNLNYYVAYSVGPDGVAATTAISNAGAVTTGGDDLCVTNGSGC